MVTVNVRVKDVSRVVHMGLEGTVDMGESGCAATKTHGPAEIITTTLAVATFPAHNTGLDSDALANNKIGDTCTYGGHSTCRFMAENQWLANSKVTITTMLIIVHYVTV